jgi:hypothetical protein
MAAGMISTNETQLQFLPNQLLKAVFKSRINIIDKRPHGNNKKADGFEEDLGIIKKSFIK